MGKRKNYYAYERSNDTQPFESKSKFDHDGKPIKVKSVDDLHDLAMDYLSCKREGTYYEAFEYTLKLIDILKRQSRTIEEIHKNYTI